MEKSYLEYQKHIMFYQTFGKGDKTVFAFHGYGRDGNDFKILGPALGEDYRIVSFDLLYHGMSDSPAYPEEFDFKKEDLRDLISFYLSENNIERFSLLAYSLGGRISLQLIELFPDKIDTVFLFAPDGLHHSFGYNFSTKTSLGKFLFKRFIKSPYLAFLIMKLGKSTGLIKDSVYKFLIMQLDTKAKRQKVFDTHIFFRNIHPDLENVQHILNTKNIKLHLFFGKYDTIIPPRYGKEFMKGLNDKEALHILESGHHLIKESVNEVLKKLMKK